MLEPKERLHKNGVFLDAQADRTLGVRVGEVMRQHITPEALARQVLSPSADEAKRVRESIDDCEPCQDNKPQGARD